MFRHADYGLNFINESSDDAKNFEITDPNFINDQDSTVLRKIQIIFNVKETNRITDPVLQDKPDKIYYFQFLSGRKQDTFLDYKQINLDLIKEQCPECEIVEDTVDYVDYYEIMGKLATIFSHELKGEGTRIAINLSSGSKMCAIAVMDAYRLWPEHIIPFYVYSLDYDAAREEGTHQGEMLKAIVPKFDYETPNIELIQAMQILDQCFELDADGKKKKTVPQAIWEKRLVESGVLDSKTEATDPRQIDMAIKNLLRNKFKDKLMDEWHYIGEKQIGKAKHLFLTDLGTRMLDIFRNYDYGLKKT